MEGLNEKMSPLSFISMGREQLRNTQKTALSLSRLLVEARDTLKNVEPRRPNTALSLSNLARFRVRRYFEDK